MRKILFVERDKNLILLYTMSFKKEGYNVDIADNADDAMNRILNHAPDIVIMDPYVIALDGASKIQRLLEVKRRIKLILNSSNNNFLATVKKWNADAYILKSSDLAKLKKLVDEFLVSEPA